MSIYELFHYSLVQGIALNLETPMPFLVGPTQPVISDKSFFIFEQEAELEG